MTVFASSRLAVPALLLASASLVCSQKATSSTPATKWLLEYAGDGDADVRRDPRFEALLTRTLPQHQFFVGDMTLAKAAKYYMGVGTGRVTVDHGRYAVVTGCVPHLCNDSGGLLWVDTQSTRPSLLFVALDPDAGTEVQGTASSYHLWIFGNELLSADTNHIGALPDDFLQALNGWVSGRKVTAAIFVEPKGMMIPLLPQPSLHLSLVEPAGSLKLDEGSI
jgi:hypothetical protein